MFQWQKCHSGSFGTSKESDLSLLFGTGWLLLPCYTVDQSFYGNEIIIRAGYTEQTGEAERKNNVLKWNVMGRNTKTGCGRSTALGKNISVWYKEVTDQIYRNQNTMCTEDVHMVFINSFIALFYSNRTMSWQETTDPLSFICWHYVKMVNKRGNNCLNKIMMEREDGSRTAKQIMSISKVIFRTLRECPNKIQKILLSLGNGGSIKRLIQHILR